MSVMVLDFKAFSLIHNKVYKAIFHNVCDGWFSSTIRGHFQYVLELEKESKRLVESWIDLNEKSWNIRYKEEQNSTPLKEFWTIEQIESTPLQLFKILQSLDYQIEVNKKIVNNNMVYFFDNGLQLTDQEQTDYLILISFKRDIMNNIISLIPEYNELCWTGEKLKKIR